MRIVSFHAYRGGNGKTNLALNVAYHLAKMGHRVVVVDGDSQAPSIHDYLAEYITQTNTFDKSKPLYHDFILKFGISFKDVLQTVRIKDVTIAVALNGYPMDVDHVSLGELQHTIPTETGVYVDLKKISEGFLELTGACDYVVIDTTPGLHRHSIFLTAAISDMVIEVIRNVLVEHKEAYKYVISILARSLRKKEKKQQASYPLHVVLNEVLKQEPEIFEYFLKESGMDPSLVLSKIEFEKGMRLLRKPCVYSAEYPDTTYTKQVGKIAEKLVELGKRG